MNNTSELNNRLLNLGKRYKPTSAFYEVTSNCNAKCDYCYIRGKSSIPDLDTAKAMKVIDSLYDAGILSIIFTGGEPFIRNDILNLLSYTAKKGFFLIGLMTNGILLEKHHLDFLIQHKEYIRTISMSAFSHEADINDHLFGVQGALNLIIKNCDYLHTHGIKILIKIVALQQNIDSLKASKIFFMEKGFDVRIYPHVFQHNTKEKANNRIRYNEDFIQKTITETAFNDSKKQSEIKHKTGTGFCRGIFTTIAIDNAGNVKPCVSFPGITIGNLLGDKSLTEILKISQLLKHLRSAQRQDIESCKNCDYVAQCSLCIGEVFINDSSLSSVPRYKCEWAKSVYNTIP